jgi:hypothetical protein
MLANPGDHIAEIEDAMVRMGGHGLAAERRRSQ